MLISESLPFTTEGHKPQYEYNRDQSNYIRVTPLSIIFKLDYLNKTNYLI